MNMSTRKLLIHSIQFDRPSLFSSALSTHVEFMLLPLPYLLKKTNRSAKAPFTLLAEEREVFSLLLQCLKSIGRKDTVMRVAGGWVRDKLIGKESNDIDIALNDCSGYQFACLVHDELVKMGSQTSRVGRIQANPEQSKHLETATIKIRDTWIDFVNLRKEVYDSTSRIPVIEFGTPEEDAFRRDLTINSLFYNLNTEQVEDYTGLGLQDLRDGLCRTPLDPTSTFHDDPLRVLRSIRFACRLGFTLHPDITIAARKKEVHDSLKSKISRERIGSEVDGMLISSRPFEAMAILSDMNLLDAVFLLPEGLTYPTEHWSFTLGCAQTLDAMYKKEPKTVVVGADAEAEDPVNGPFQHRILWLSLLLHPFYQATYPGKKGGKLLSVIESIIKDSLKFRNRDSEDVLNVIQGVHKLRIFIKENENLESGIIEKNDDKRLELGWIIRNLGSMWGTALDIGKCVDLHSTYSDKVVDTAGKEKRATEIKHRYNVLIERVNSLGFNGCWLNKPLVKGPKLISLGVPKGPTLGKVTTQVISWHLLYPHGTVEECEAYVQTLFPK